MMNMSLLDEFIASSDHIIMNFVHYRDGGDVVIKVLFVSLLSFL